MSTLLRFPSLVPSYSSAQLSSPHKGKCLPLPSIPLKPISPEKPKVFHCSRHSCPQASPIALHSDPFGGRNATRGVLEPCGSDKWRGVIIVRMVIFPLSVSLHIQPDEKFPFSCCKPRFSQTNPSCFSLQIPFCLSVPFLGDLKDWQCLPNPHPTAVLIDTHVATRSFGFMEM